MHWKKNVRKPLPGRVALVEFRADWAQYCQTFGFNTHSAEHPRFLCNARKSNLFELGNAHEWEPRTHDEFIDSCRQNLIRLKLTTRDTDVVWDHLDLDFRKKGRRGRIVKKDIDVLDLLTGKMVQLLKGDRLEVGLHCGDIHCSRESLPADNVELVFNRFVEGSVATHVSVLFAIPGFRFEYMMLDSLHTLDLGVAQRLSGEVIHKMLKKGILGHTQTVVGYRRGLCKLSRQLKQFYKDYANMLGPARRFNRVGRVTLKMLGLHKNMSKTANLNIKGGEGRHFFQFTCKLIQDHAGVLGSPHLRKACFTLKLIYQIMKDSPRELPTGVQVQLLAAAKAMGEALTKGRHHCTPKVHLAYHLCEQSALAGNPRFYSCHEDESHLRDVRTVVQAAHTGSYEAKVLAKLWKMDTWDDENVNILGLCAGGDPV